MAVTDNAAQGRFELEEQGKVAYARYRREDGLLTISYVEAPPSLRGTGTAGRLMQGVMERAREEGVKVLPMCSYAALWVRRHPEHHDLLARP